MGVPSTSAARQVTIGPGTPGALDPGRRLGEGEREGGGEEGHAAILRSRQNEHLFVCERSRYPADDERARPVQPGDARVVRAGVRRRRRPRRRLGWPAIASGEHTLIQAPTGSGKTLAAFLYGIDRLNAAPGEGLRLLYVSPLKALNYDVERNLRGPLAGLQSELTRRRAHRRHAAEGARGDAAQAARHPDHDARVALPAAHLAGRARCSERPDADPRRGACRRGHEARRAPRARRSSGSTGSSASPSSASASPRRSARSRRSAASSSGARPIRLVDAGTAQGARPAGRRPGRGHARAGRGRAARDRRQLLGTGGEGTRRPRSGRRSTPSCCGSSRSTARRSSSSTTAASPSGSRCA